MNRVLILNYGEYSKKVFVTIVSKGGEQRV